MRERSEQLLKMFGDVLKTVYEKYGEDNEEVVVMNSKRRTRHAASQVGSLFFCQHRCRALICFNGKDTLRLPQMMKKGGKRNRIEAIYSTQGV